MKIRLLLPLLALALYGCVSTKPATGVPGMSQRVYEHPRWGNVIRFTNGEVEAVVAPELGGRVMHYSRFGEPNLLWTAADIGGGLGDLWGWRNWGGEKIWPWPQDNWPDKWPPPRDIEQEPWKVEHIVYDNNDGGRYIHVIMSVKTRFGLLVRQVNMPAAGTDLKIITMLAGGTNDFSVWSVVQIPVPEIVVVERTAPRRLLLQMPDAEDGNALVMRDEDTFDLAATPGGTKGMLDADTFRVPTPQGTLVVRQSFGPRRKRLLPKYEDVYRAQICKVTEQNGDDSYLELEFAAPLPGGGASSQMVTLSLE